MEEEEGVEGQAVVVGRWAWITCECAPGAPMAQLTHLWCKAAVVWTTDCLLLHTGVFQRAARSKEMQPQPNPSHDAHLLKIGDRKA